MNKIWKFAITGGPCGGKTTGIPIIKDYFENKGYKVFTIPEAVTIINGKIGLNFTDLSRYQFQSVVANTMFFLEEQFTQLSKLFDQDIIILCDRGILDNKAYLSYDEFKQLLKDHNINEIDALNRYNAVFHLVTAADGAKDFYRLDGIRFEDLDNAIITDRKTQAAWSTHPNFYLIDNSTDFETKINRLITKICEIIE